MFGYAEINLLCVAILIIMSYKIRRSDKSQEQLYLAELMISQSVMFLLDTAWVLIDSDSFYPPMLNFILNILYFTATAICPYYALRYFKMSFRGEVFSKKQQILLTLPALAVLLLCTVSLKTGWVFTVTAQNVYQRGFLYPAVYVIPLLYMIGNACASVWYGKTSGNRDARRRGIRLAVVFILPVIGSTLQSIFPGITVVCGFITASMVAVVIDFLQSRMTKDTLTQLANRYDLMLTLEERLTDYHPDERGAFPLYLLFADVDYFKSINDNYGHLEGDKALCTVANALRSVCRAVGGYPARISGDEFVVLFSAQDDSAAEQFKGEVKRTVAASSEKLPYALRISAGLTRCAPGDRENLPALLDRADALLYEEKKQRPPRE